MSPNASRVLSYLLERASASAKQIAAALGLAIEATYEALVQLESAGRTYIATQALRWRHEAGERCRLWCAYPAEFWSLEAA